MHSDSSDDFKDHFSVKDEPIDLDENPQMKIKDDLDCDEVDLKMEFMSEDELLKLKQEINEDVNDIGDYELKDFGLEDDDELRFDFEGFHYQKFSDENESSNDFEGFLSQDDLSHKQEMTSSTEPFQLSKKRADIKSNNVSTSQVQDEKVKITKKITHKNDSSNADVLKCLQSNNDCKNNSLQSEASSSDKRPTKKRNTDAKRFKCPQCSYKGRDRCRITRHQLSHSDKKLFKCSSCSFQTNYKGYIKKHNLYSCPNQLKVVPPEGPKLRCNDCEFQTHLKGILLNHIRSHSLIKLFSCSKCEYGTHDPSLFRRHKLVHSNLKSYSCSECPFKSNHLRSLRTHSLKHLKEKLFKCNDCSYECSRKDVLKVHVLTHTDYKRFHCSLCEYKCCLRNSLKMHMLKHSAESTILNCFQCKYKTWSKACYEKHLSSHSEEEVFKCLICKYESNDKSVLRTHILTHSVSES